ncbi:MAG: isoaspartyl peptidase/L-asparaginase [Bacteriovoracaceae bacterium]|nr:isoaspartyl peptidase/L-asparaginase [Bacteriovoracaceae bacterium]
MGFNRAILTHGGSASDPNNSDGPKSAVQIGMSLMGNGKSALDAVIQSVKYLEDDPRFNAGRGSQIRADGTTIQMDASCMTSCGKFGAVACVEDIQNPVALAKAVLLHSPNIIIAGEGTKIFAREQNIQIIPSNHFTNRVLEKKKNTPSCDTVGAIAFDGETFAAALSSGGLDKSAIGRVGDVPLPGCGLFCGPLGAIACTGDGEFIALKILAKEVYSWLERGITPNEAVKMAIDLFEDSVDLGLIILTKNEFASNSRHGMAWAHSAEIKKA